MMQIILSLTLIVFLWVVPLNNQNNEALAFPSVDSEEINVNSADLLYKGKDKQKTNVPDIGVRLKDEKVGASPAKPQKFIDPSDFNNKILEKIRKQFQEASAFLDDK